MSNVGETEIEVPIETFPIHKEKDPSSQASKLPPHRIVLILIGLALVASAAFSSCAGTGCRNMVV